MKQSGNSADAVCLCLCPLICWRHGSQVNENAKKGISDEVNDGMNGKRVTL